MSGLTGTLVVLALFAVATLTEVRWGESRHGPFLVTALLLAGLLIAIWQLVARL